MTSRRERVFVFPPQILASFAPCLAGSSAACRGDSNAALRLVRLAEEGTIRATEPGPELANGQKSPFFLPRFPGFSTGNLTVARWISRRSLEPLQASGTFIFALFVVALAEALSPYPIATWGIEPRTQIGLRGIVFSPLLHGSWEHLLANALPLFVLLAILLADKRYRPTSTLAIIWLASGFGTWLIGRSGSLHIGASSIIFGLAAYLIVAGFLMRSWRAAFVALAVFFCFGGIFYGVLPQRGPISWEGHLCGAIAGVWAAWRQQG